MLRNDTTCWPGAPGAPGAAALQRHSALSLRVSRNSPSINGSTAHDGVQAWVRDLPFWAALFLGALAVLLAGAAACDEATRRHDLRTNPAALMALMWHHATKGRGEKDLRPLTAGVGVKRPSTSMAKGRPTTVTM